MSWNKVSILSQSKIYKKMIKKKKVPFLPHEFEKHYIFLLLKIHNSYKYTKGCTKLFINKDT